MKIIRDDKRIYRLRRISQYAFILGLLLLVTGLVLAFTDLASRPNFVFIQLLALLGGWILAQMGSYLGNRYGRKPRADEIIDEAAEKIHRNGRMYHYVLPAPHVLLTPRGIILFVPKYQVGRITADGDKWKQRGIGLRRFFGQDALGNPSREAATYVGALADFIRKKAPEVDEVPIAPVIVFTSKNIESLDIEKSDIPAVHAPRLKALLRKRKRETIPNMPKEDYEALRAAFDKKAGHLVDEEQTPAEAA